MQFALGASAKAGDVAGVGRYFGLVEDDVEHIEREILSSIKKPSELRVPPGKLLGRALSSDSLIYPN